LTPYRLRPAEGGDIQEIAVMSRCLIEVGLRGWTWHPTRVARALRTRETCVLAAETPFENSPNRLAGFAIAEFGDSKMHLSLFAVKPAYQRSGIGLAMIEWLIESALTAGIDHITVEMRANNFAARSFYEALGPGTSSTSAVITRTSKRPFACAATCGKPPPWVSPEK
jgi:ribosomal protein S18 acetylase RimI-like enzyme